MQTLARWACACVVVCGVVAPRAAAQQMDVDKAQAEKTIARAIDFLKSKQDAETGGWSVPPKGTAAPTFPAISALVLNGMLMQPGIRADDAAVSKGGAFVLGFAKPDGGIYDTMLPTYNTAISLSALARLNTPAAKAAVGPAQEFLRRSQWGSSEPLGVGGAGGKEAPAAVGREHPFYGGVGYGNRGRPDISNLAFFLQGLHDSGVPTDDPAVQRALVFLQRCQMLASAGGKTVNDQPFAAGSRQGGFVYATAENDKTLGEGQSFAGRIEETLDDGTKVSKLASYGSVTYLGFKSYIYAGLAPTDPRVRAAYDWIKRNYDLSVNTGMPAEEGRKYDGYYYYLLAMGRALDAGGLTTINTIGADGATAARNWRADLLARLAELQQEDGSFRVLDDRWMEDNPVLITAYGLIAAQHALRGDGGAAAASAK
ncbi:MAG: hypothetical protein ACKVS8_00130 [Phycisphaerales bacterium]